MSRSIDVVSLPWHVDEQPTQDRLLHPHKPTPSAFCEFVLTYGRISLISSRRRRRRRSKEVCVMKQAPAVRTGDLVRSARGRGGIANHKTPFSSLPQCRECVRTQRGMGDVSSGAGNRLYR